MKVSDFMGQRVPDDTTLGTLKRYFANSDIAKELQKRVKGTLRVEFRYEGSNRDCHEKMTLLEFRRLATDGIAYVTITNGEGGLSVELEPAER